MAPSNGNDFARMIALMSEINDRPSAIRYPRGESEFNIDLGNIKPIEIGKGEIIKQGSKIAVLSYGTILSNVLAADKILGENHNINITIADAKFCKPLDENLIKNLTQTHQFLITIEEGSIGGFGSVVSDFILKNGLLDNGNLKLRCLHMSDNFIEHNSIIKMQEEAGIGVKNIVDLILSQVK